MPMLRVLLATLCLAAIAAPTNASATDGRVEGKGLKARLVSHSVRKLEADCCTPKPVCCPTPCVTYVHCGPKLCCGCEPGKPITMTVKDPCTGCETEIQVCLPACCEGEPTMCCGTGLFCRDVINYEWCCGFRVKVIFKHCGDLIVKTWGR